ncbi:MAG: hypothetical protein JWR85_4028 [Marmoricola sp.]|nr:hypothetical protein [Marmoricola sp.]
MRELSTARGHKVGATSNPHFLALRMGKKFSELLPSLYSRDDDGYSYELT